MVGAKKLSVPGGGSVVGGLTVSIKVIGLEPPALAVMVTKALLVTVPAVAAKRVERLPSGTETRLGTVSAIWALDARVTAKPPVGAAADSPIVQLAELPPETGFGAQLSE